MSGGHDKSVLGVAVRRLRHGRRRLRRLRAHGDARHDQGRRFPHHLQEPDLPDLVVRLRARPQAGARQEAGRVLLRIPLPGGDAKEFNGDDRFFPITYQKDWAVVRKIAEESGTPFNRAAYDAEAKREAEALARRSNSNRRRSNNRPMDAAAPFKPDAAGGNAGRSLVIRNLRKEYRAGQPVLKDVSLDGRGPRHDRDHRPVRHRQVDADPLHQPAGRSDLRRDPVPRPGHRASFSGRALRRTRRRIGMVFQEYNLVERLSVMENVLTGRLGYVAVWRAWLRRFDRQGHRPRASNCSTRSGSARSRTSAPTSSPAASASASASPAP